MAENQSMFLDAYANDAAWLGRWVPGIKYLFSRLTWCLNSWLVSYPVVLVPSLPQPGPTLDRYARNKAGEVIPWSVIEAHTTATHPYEVFALRGMLAVPYFEKALYELPEDQLSVEALLALADKVEADLQGGLSPRPLLSVRLDGHSPAVL